MKYFLFLLISMSLLSCTPSERPKRSTKSNTTKESTVSKHSTPTSWKMNNKQFLSLLKENGMTFNLPKNFTSSKVAECRDMPISYAIKSNDGNFEVRYWVEPISRLKEMMKGVIGGKKPNDFYKSQIEINAMNISGHSHEIVLNAPSDEAVKHEFGGDKALYCKVIFKYKPTEYSKGFSRGILWVIHKQDEADLYITFMSKNISNEEFNKYLEDSFYTIKFRG